MVSGLALAFLNVWDSMLTFLFYSWPFILLIIIFIQRIRWRKHPIEAIIIEKRGENLIKTNDRVGKFYDKYSDMTSYRLQKSGDSIPVYNFDWILHNVTLPTNILERYINIVRGNSGTVFLFRYGSKQYKPINIKENGGKVQLTPVKDNKGEVVYSYQYMQFDPRNLMGALEFEVIDWDNMNFMVQEQRASILRRQKKGEFWKQTLIPLAIIGASVVVAIFILKFSMDAGRELRGASASAPTQQPGVSGSKVGGVISDVVSPGQ